MLIEFALGVINTAEISYILPSMNDKNLSVIYFTNGHELECGGTPAEILNKIKSILSKQSFNKKFDAFINEESA